MTGNPESAYSFTVLVVEAPNVFEAVNTTSCTPKSFSPGVHFNTPLFESKVAPRGNPSAARRTSRPWASAAMTVRAIGLRGVPAAWAGTTKFGAPDDSKAMEC